MVISGTMLQDMKKNNQKVKEMFFRDLLYYFHCIVEAYKVNKQLNLNI